MPVKTGLDYLSEVSFRPIKGAKLGICANQASIDSNFNHIVDLVSSEESCEIVRLFAPEHGIRGELQDMEHITELSDPLTGLPVVSLYGSGAETLVPSEDSLRDLDAILVDLPDIGSRYYTFAQTLAYTMRTAAKTNTKVIVVDRPNPINGTSVEGGSLIESCVSFCGLYPTSNRHGMTLGELAKMFKEGIQVGEFGHDPIGCELEILPVSGWSREMYFDQTGLPWVFPSPNMPTIEAAITYPGTCLFEGTNLSEGRGTTMPFELLGAPFIDGEKWAEAVYSQGIKLEGVFLRPVYFKPKFSKWANEPCSGVQIHITDREKYDPYRFGLALIASAKELYPNDFKWRQETYEFVENTPAIDLLFGSPDFRNCVNQGRPVSSLLSNITTFEKEFTQKRHPFLLY